MMSRKKLLLLLLLMKHSSFRSFRLGISASISLVAPALAVVNIDFVTVGNAGNAADDSTGSLYGAVAYAYQVGKYEVTNSQYTDFLNAVDPDGANPNGIYNTNMGSSHNGGISYNAGAASGSQYTIRASMGDKPVNWVSWYDSARFTNWVNNGQGAGSTETGAYTLTGSGNITRNVEATVWLPSEDEWYKAAYYDPTPGASGNNYWLYPTQSDTVPTVGVANATGDITNAGENVANYNYGPEGRVTTVGSAVANNFYGTFDQGGNVYEYNDAVNSDSLRGGNMFSRDSVLASSYRNSGYLGNTLEDGYAWVGFRVASVPEPTSLFLTILTIGMMLARRKR